VDRAGLDPGVPRPEDSGGDPCAEVRTTALVLEDTAGVCDGARWVLDPQPAASSATAASALAATRRRRPGRNARIGQR
jgi:hypothetical protein